MEKITIKKDKALKFSVEKFENGDFVSQIMTNENIMEVTQNLQKLARKFAEEQKK